MLNRTRIALITLALILTLAFTPALAEGMKAGETAPDFELTTLEGEVIRLSDLQGKVVLLNIWATWCPPCVGEIPDLQKLAEAHPDELVVIGASMDESEADVREFIAADGVTYPIGMDEEYRLGGELYATMYIPESVFIDPEGTIADVVVGGMAYDDMEAGFQKALGR